jgi:hypothetical protein
VEAIGRLRSSFRRKGRGCKKAPPGPKTWQIDNNVISVCLNVYPFSINGKTQVGKNVEGQCHRPQGLQGGTSNE